MQNTSITYAYLIRDQLALHAKQNKTAIVWEDEDGALRRLTYGDLQQKVLHLAARLQTLSCVRKGNSGQCRIGLWLPRTADYVISFLATWIAGGVYVPISDASLKRVQENLEFKQELRQRVQTLEPNVDVMISDEPRLAMLKEFGISSLVDFQEICLKNSGILQAIRQDSNSEAFVFCSSGTTAAPKMIAVPYDGIADRVHTVSREMQVTAEDSILQYTGFDFDPSVMEMLQALQFGSPLIIAPEYARLDPSALGRFYEKLKTQHISLPNFAIIVPSMLKVMDHTIFSNLKGLMTTGENILPKDLLPWFALNDFLKIFTGFGPTETTWGATLTEIPRNSPQISISQAMDGIELYVVPICEDEEEARPEDLKKLGEFSLVKMLDQPKAGLYEIIIGGNGLGKYIGAQATAMTEKNWIQHEGKSYFRPRDGVTLENGKLLYCGRLSDVIKYHGKWLSLDAIDNITEKHDDVKFATSVAIPGTSIIFLFLVAKGNSIDQNSVEKHLRVSGFSLTCILFQVNALQINARGKRSRKLEAYLQAHPLSPTSLQPNSLQSLSMMWFQALSETDLSSIQHAFEKIGISAYENYLTNYAAEDRFDAVGGKSLKFTRLVTLLWKEIFKKTYGTPHSQQTFKIGLLRHQSLRDMSLYLQRYEITIRSLQGVVDEVNSCPGFECFLNNEAWDSASKSDLEEMCEILTAEIKASKFSPFYHVILNGRSEALLEKVSRKLSKYFGSQAIIDYIQTVSSRDTFLARRAEIEKVYRQHLIKARLCQTPHWETSEIHIQNEWLSLNKLDTTPITFLGTACGKTTLLKQHFQHLRRQHKVVCYISCRDLLDEANNLKSLLNLSRDNWAYLCEGPELLSEITWLIDDLEAGMQDSRLLHLQQCLRSLKGKNYLIYCGRENCYPWVTRDPAQYGDVIECPRSNATVNYHQWFQAEAERCGLSASIFLRHLKLCYNELLAKKYIPSQSSRNWWPTATLDKLQKNVAPLYITQSPSFPSLVRFLKLYDTGVYALRQEYKQGLADFMASSLRIESAPESSQEVLPSNFHYLPGDPDLSPWIFFHSISGESPDGYLACAEMIYRHTRQGSVIISMPHNMDGLTLKAQVKTYLETIEQQHCVPTGGPYYLLGWSYGGYLAVEAALQLEQQGKSVAVVVNLDAVPLFTQTNFPWEIHTTFILQHIKPQYLSQTLGNVARLEEYCQHFANGNSIKLKSRNYIFAAAIQAESMSGIAFSGWDTIASSTRHLRCASDHFGIFSDPEFRIQFNSILNEHREHADSRSLRDRLGEKSAAYVRNQEKLNSTLPKYHESTFESKIRKEFLAAEDSPQCLIIEGHPGVGKSRLVNHLAQTLLSEERTSWYPIILPLRLYMGIRDFNSILKIYGLSTYDLRQMNSMSQRFVFIIDGFDEGDLEFSADLFADFKPCRNVKLIITVRKGLRFPHLAHLSWELPLLSREALAAWLDCFSQVNRAHLEKQFQSNKTTLTWLRTPLALGMLLKLQQAKRNILDLINNPFLLFRSLNGMLQDQIHPPLKKMLSQRHFLDGYQRYTETLSLSQWLGRETTHDSTWNHPDPVTQSFKKTAQIYEENSILTFPHITWRDYHLAKALLCAVVNFEPPMSSPPIPSILSYIKINEFPKNEFMVKLLLNCWETAEEDTRQCLRKNLFMILFISRRYRSMEYITRAASAAMDMLNIFLISFAELDLSDLTLSRCDLSGAILTKSNLMGTRIHDSNMTSTCIEGANFQDAELMGIECGELPSLSGDLMSYSSDGKQLVISEGGMLRIYDTHLYHQRWSRSVSDKVIQKLIVTSQNLIACCTSDELILVDLNDLENSSKNTFSAFNYRIDDFAFSAKGNEIAVLLSSGDLLMVSEDLQQYRSFAACSPSQLAYPRNSYKQFLACDHVGTQIAAIVERKLYLWNCKSGALLSILGEKNFHQTTALAYHPTRDILIVCDQGIHVIDTVNTVILRHFPHNASRSFPRIVWEHNPDQFLVVHELEVTRYHLGAGSEHGTEILFPDMTDDILLSPDGKQLAGIADHKHIYLLDLETEQIERRLDVSTSNILEIAYHPQGVHFAALTAAHRIHLWSVALKPNLQQVLTQADCPRIPANTGLFFEFSGRVFQFMPHNRSLQPYQGTIAKPSSDDSRSYTPQGDYFAKAKSFPSLIQICHANSGQCIHQFSITKHAQDLVWLESGMKDQLGDPVYHLSFTENYSNVKVYEVIFSKQSAVELNLIWCSARHSTLQGQERLMQTSARPSLRPMEKSPSPLSLKLLFLLRISDYLSYQDYCVVMMACKIPAEILETHRKRPVIEAEAWQKRSYHVGKQLQLLGFFALNRAVDLHHLQLVPIADSYQSLMISEQRGENCGECDIYLLNDLMHHARKQ